MHDPLKTRFGAAFVLALTMASLAAPRAQQPPPPAAPPKPATPAAPAAPAAPAPKVLVPVGVHPGAIEAIRTVPQPVLAAIEGFCVGGGLEIAVACDLRIATDDARIGAPVGKVGFPFALPELLPLLVLVGPGVAADLLLAGRVFNGSEAQACGLVQRAVPRDDHARVIEATTRAIATASPVAARQNKAQIRNLLDGGYAYTREQLEASFGFLDSEDYREGIAAFLAKRPPRFAGK